jgi:hypothetical protein
VEMEEEALVRGVGVPACTSEPPPNSSLSKAEDSLGGRSVEPFGQSREHQGDLVRGGFQAIQRGVVSGTEGAVAGLTAKSLDRLSTPMLAVPDKCMDMSVCDPTVQTLLIGASEVLRIHPLGCSPAAFHHTAGA